ncbi:hypothetical protein B005_0427 [Nocardiopsis alba ATCC BAA-2165]|uniref:Uncharacterized protein n=1 Tax=Nocardiopsis alba (strain ATCC BAA-2165 / BE74) TaxID=1205910 RepID=J7LAB3_NOCAA|nr:hypothetical protein B005_0427 [Nocardiopsis alba ATCC BAA-2165]
MRSGAGLLSGHTGSPDGSRGSDQVGQNRSHGVPGQADPLSSTYR